ncbi:L,D-transpeptidase family protein [Hymenobacter cheonanensis]|uniref:L,D-transpeptidase family protein n=1 Tax=Hymenobacter sp. CA2-7 TaxID=3063993 RepID=UPI002712F159|nr:L,D-transpeptidase family protein [Hymenobacter sp. CA2-7]MDO7887310.1 L,D-transpeptidase family protein [Hymenobacter sp. CA2-7]
MRLQLRLHFLSLALFLGLLSVPVLLTSCNGQGDQTSQASSKTGTAVTANNTGPEPHLDSVFVIRAMQADAHFKAQERWARKFYRERQFRLGWFKEHQLVPQATTFLTVVSKAKDDGLEPKRYDTKQITDLLAQLKSVGQDTARRNQLERKLDVTLSGSYFAWASDYYRGVANPRDTKNDAWKVKRNKIKLDHALMTILRERESTYPYYDFAPLHPEYNNLKKALGLLRARQSAGGWPTLPGTTHLKPGDALPVVGLLRQRLLGGEATGQTPAAVAATATPVNNVTPAPAAAANKYDPTLVAAVKSFQADLGLPPTGLVSGETLRQLNVPIQARIDQVILNMERWRWLPKKFEPDYLIVNIPEYRLRVFEQGKEALTMRVIVGKTLTATPVFSDKMEYVVLAPYWNVPFSIIDKELRPKLVADAQGTLDRLDMEVVKGYGRKATVVDPSTIDWANVTQATFKYTMRRRPGPKNDLGDVKFIFPNSNDIYLHDTPHGELFSQTKRNFSHGCVRVEEPVKLATYLLRDNPNWSQPAIEDTIAQHREKYITLKEKLPVYLVYLTAWADANGHAHFRDDIYGHDQTLAKEYFN